MKIGIIGGGVTGLALAQRLTGGGRSITLFERELQLGGLATWQDYGRFDWDRFYHCILPSDRHLIAFIRDLGLEEQLRWTRTLTGFYVDREFHSLSSGLDFLRFRPLSVMGKLRLAFTILYCAGVRNWRRLESVRACDWLRRLSGRRTYERIWRPLLLAKLGQNHERVSAVFIWAYIKRLFSARDPATQKEALGYVSGGYKTVVKRIEQQVRGGGGTIHLGVAVRRIAPIPTGGLLVEWDAGNEHFDKVIFTSPVNVLQVVADPALCHVERPDGARVEYLGVICMVLVTAQPLVPYYVVNIADERVFFTGLIGMSNLVTTAETGGLHLTYLPKYVHSDDPLLHASDDTLRELFMGGLRLMFPHFDAIHVESVHINRATKVQPLQVLGYSRLVPSVVTRHDDFFVLNTSQFTGNTLNNNEVIRAVDEFVRDHGDALAADSERSWRAAPGATTRAPTKVA